MNEHSLGILEKTGEHGRGYAEFFRRIALDADGIVDVDLLRKAMEGKRGSAYVRGTSIEFAPKGNNVREFNHFSSPFTHEFGERPLLDDHFRVSDWVRRPIFQIDPSLNNAFGADEGSDEKMRKLLTHVQNLLDFAQHDFSMHGTGIDVPNTYMYDLVDVPKYAPHVSTAESIALIMHRVLFERLARDNPILKRFLLREAFRALKLVGQIQNEEHRKQWVQIIQYPLSALLNPVGEDMQALQGQVKDFGVQLRPTRWGALAHTHTFRIRDSRVSISDQELFDLFFLKMPETGGSYEILIKKLDMIRDDRQSAQEKWHRRLQTLLRNM
jgi:hypothetical protein